jgi:hypothetical protein
LQKSYGNIMSHYYQKIEIDYLDQIMTKCLAYVKTQEDIYFQKQVGAYRNLNFNELILIILFLI